MALKVFESKVLEKKNVSPDVIELSLSVPDDFSFEAGQFVSLKVERDGQKRMKSYSILNPPSEKGVLRLCIKLVPGGFASEHFKVTKAGDTFEVRGPLGEFKFQPDAPVSTHFFIGTGTGLVPLHSMILENLEKHPDKKFVLLFGARYENGLLYDALWKALAQKHANFAYWPCLSRQEGWTGRCGHVQAHFKNPDTKDTMYYMCGLKEMVLEAREQLERAGVPKDRIKFERFN